MVMAGVRHPRQPKVTNLQRNVIINFSVLNNCEWKNYVLNHALIVAATSSVELRWVLWRVLLLIVCGEGIARAAHGPQYTVDFEKAKLFSENLVQLSRWKKIGKNVERRGTLRSQLELSRMFDGFRSRCNTLAEWIYFRPLGSVV